MILICLFGSLFCLFCFCFCFEMLIFVRMKYRGGRSIMLHTKTLLPVIIVFSYLNFKNVNWMENLPTYDRFSIQVMFIQSKWCFDFLHKSNKLSCFCLFGSCFCLFCFWFSFEMMIEEEEVLCCIQEHYCLSLFF